MAAEAGLCRQGLWGGRHHRQGLCEGGLMEMITVAAAEVSLSPGGGGIGRLRRPSLEDAEAELRLCANEIRDRGRVTVPPHRTVPELRDHPTPVRISLRRM